MKKYKLITEVSPIQIQIDSEIRTANIQEIFKNSWLTPIDAFKEQPILPSFITEIISEETFKVLSNICNIEMDKYGEKTYICNNIKMKIEEAGENS